MNSDFKELLRIFNEKQVKYLVIGGYAVMKHSEPRFTKDLDLWVWTAPENAKLVFRALQEFGAPLTGLAEADFTQPEAFYQMGRPPVRIDILMSIDGIDFEEAWGNHIESDFDGVPAHIISKQDLITAKRAAGRPQDLVDLESLTLPEKK